jgi:hypothetical protein
MIIEQINVNGTDYDLMPPGGNTGVRFVDGYVSECGNYPAPKVIVNDSNDSGDYCVIDSDTGKLAVKRTGESGNYRYTLCLVMYSGPAALEFQSS